MVSLLPATATNVGIVVLAQVPSLTDAAGVALVACGAGMHSEADSTAPDGPRLGPRPLVRSRGEESPSDSR